MQSAPPITRFADLQIDAVPDAPRDVIPPVEKETSTAGGISPSIVSLHGPEGVTITEVDKQEESPSTTKLRSQQSVSESQEDLKNKRSSGRRSSGQKIDMGRHFPPLKIPFSVPPMGSGGGNLVLVNQSNGVHVGDSYVYNSTTVTSPPVSSSMKFGNVGPKPKKVDMEEKCLEELRAVTDRITVEDITAISTHIGVNWKVLGRRLKYTDGQLEQFYLNFEKLQMKEVVYQMLLDWKRTRTSKATVKSLAKHLYKSNEIDAMMELHKITFSDP